MTRQKVDVRRDEILRATCDEVAKRGFASTRAADVAAALGVSTGLIFYHFESKDALLSAAFAYAAERDLERLDEAAHGKGSALRRLARILTMYGPEGAGAGWALWIDAWAAALRSPEMAAVSRQLDVRWKESVAAVIAQGVATGEMTCDDPSGAAWRITALLDGLAVQSTVHEGVLSRRQVTAWVRANAARELGVEPRELRG
ncbi:MAG: TetR/AcrR family transcriptional regulator [Actinomycetes bacterium]